MKSFCTFFCLMLVAVFAFQLAPDSAHAALSVGSGEGLSLAGLLMFGTVSVFDEVKALFEQFKAANDERLKQIEAKGHADPLLENKVDNINAAISTLEATIKAMEDKINRAEFGNPGTPEDKARAEYRAGFNAFARRGDIQASLSVGSDPDGGYSVPIEVDKEILQLERNEVTMRRLAKIVTLGTPNYSKIVNKGGATSGWVGETDARGETDAPKLAALTPFWGEVYANPGATQQMLDDSGFDVEGWLAEELSMEFAAQENDKFINGSGILTPKGILAYPMALTADATRAFGTVQYIKTTEAAAFKAASATFNPADNLIDMQQALKPAFRNNAVWLMNSTTVGTVRKFKDAVNGAYIYQPSIVLGTPATLLGKPIEEDENMPAIGANAFPIAYGDFKRAYTICDRIGTRVLRDPFTNKPYIMFYTTKRVGGFLANSNAIKTLKMEA